jgi:hypothetical protein
VAQEDFLAMLSGVLKTAAHHPGRRNTQVPSRRFAFFCTILNHNWRKLNKNKPRAELSCGCLIGPLFTIKIDEIGD